MTQHIKAKDAKQICSLPLNKGMLTGDEPWVLSKDCIAKDKTVTIQTRFKGTKIRTKYKDKETKELLFEDFSKDWRGHHVVRKDKDGNVLFMMKAWRGGGYDSIYLYTPRPAFKGQEPSEERLEDQVEVDLYVFARLEAIKEFRTRVVKFSYCKGMDPDHESGYAWKDLYKGIKKPQFSYAATVVDMQDNVICKSREAGPMDMNPIYEVAPGVDTLAMTTVCFPILPDGTMVWTGLDFATWFIFWW